jgi:hypothetical protein
MKNSHTLALIFVLFSVFGCSIADKNNTRADYPKVKIETLPPPEAVPKNDLLNALPRLLLNNYEQIENGMSYEKVVKIIGSDGIETRRSSLENIELRDYKWKGENYQRIYVSFRNDKVVSKSQSGLK